MPVKNEKKILFYLIIILIIFLNNKISYAYKANPSTEGGKAVCETAESMLSYMDSDGGWRYNSKMPASYKKNWSIAKRHKQSTCGTFVKWVFQEAGEAGYLKPNTTISHKSTASSTKSAYQKNTVNCTWYTPNKKLSAVKDELLPGDCIIFPETIAIFAGYENGTYYTYNCINDHRFKECISAKGARETNFLHKYKLICVVRPGQGGQSPNLTSETDSNSSSQGTAVDDENETFMGALGNIARNILDSMITLFENYIYERNDSTVMYDLNPDDDDTFYGNGGAPDGTMVNEPDATSIKKFASTKGVPIQNFAITDLNTSPIVWLGCNPGKGKNKRETQDFTVKIYKNFTTSSLGHMSAKVTLRFGGHQCLDVWKNGNRYNIYTGSQGTKGTWNSHYHRWYFNPKGIAKSVIESTTGNGSANMANKGIAVTNGSKYILVLAVDENDNKMVTIVSGVATVWELNTTSFNSSSKTGTKFRVNTGKLFQGGCLSGNYLYLVGGHYCDSMPIGCYDITTGKQIWYKTLNTTSITGKYEPEGIKVYNYKGSNKIFIAFNRGGGIWYFDN